MQNDPALLDELARVFALAAVEEFMREEKSRRSSDEENGGFEEKEIGKAESTRSFSAAPQ